jgi:MFS family permease
MGYLALIAAYAVLSVSQSIVLLVCGYVLLGLFSACADGAQRAHVSHIVPAEHRGAAYGYLNAAVGFGVLVAGVVGGYTWEHAGSSVALFAAISVVFVGLVFFMSTLKSHPSVAR